MRWRSELLLSELVGRSVGLGQGQYGSIILRLDSNFGVLGTFRFLFVRDFVHISFTNFLSENFILIDFFLPSSKLFLFLFFFFVSNVSVAMNHCMSIIICVFWIS